MLRLANDVRVLTYALAYLQQRLTEAIEGRNSAATASAAAEREWVIARGEVQRLTGELHRISAEAHQLQQAALGANRQAEQWAEQARQAELRLHNGLQAANAHIAALTEQAAALEAAINQLRQTTAQQRADLETARRERDAARQRVAELETDAKRDSGLIHPRANIAAVRID